MYTRAVRRTWYTDPAVRPVIWCDVSSGPASKRFWVVE